MKCRTENLQKFIVKRKGYDHVDQWLKTIYRDKNGAIYMPAVSKNMERFFLAYLKQENIDFVLDDREHVYINSEDMAEIFPDRIELIENAKRIVLELSLCDSDNLH